MKSRNIIELLQQKDPSGEKEVYFQRGDGEEEELLNFLQVVEGETQRYSLDIHYDNLGESITEIHVSPNTTGETLCVKLSNIEDIPIHMLDESFDITGYDYLNEHKHRSFFSLLRDEYIKTFQNTQRWKIFSEFTRGYNISSTAFQDWYDKYVKDIPTLEGKREFMKRHFKIEEIKKPSFIVDTKISYVE